MLAYATTAALAYLLAPAGLLPGTRPLSAVTAPRVRSAPVMEQGVESLPPTAAQKTWFPKAADTAKSNKKWFLVDAEGLRLGRMSSEVAKLLIGKHKPEYTPGANVGDAVVIINAEKVIVTGNKAKEKLYRRHSGRPGGMKIESYEELQARIPERIVEKAIVGMLPKNSYGREMFRNLKARTPSPPLRGNCPQGSRDRAHRDSGHRSSMIFPPCTFIPPPPHHVVQVYKGAEHPHDAQSPEPLAFGGLTSMPDTQLLEFVDPDSIKCA